MIKKVSLLGILFLVFQTNYSQIIRTQLPDTISNWTKENKVPFTALVTFQIRDFLDFLKRDSKNIS